MLLYGHILCPFFSSTKCQLPTSIASPIVAQVIKEMHKILGQVDILGSPILLGSSLITGVTSFFYEPAKGAQLGPEEFAKGLGKGAWVLCSHVVIQ